METIGVVILGFISAAIIILGVVFFIVEVVQYRRFQAAVEIFNDASEAYAHGLNGVQTAVNNQADSLIAMGEALERHDKSLDQHELTLDIINISIKALSNALILTSENKTLDNGKGPVVQSKRPVVKSE